MFSRKELVSWARESVLVDRTLKEFLWDKKGLIVLGFISLSVLILYWQYVWAAFTILMLIAIGFVSMLYNKVVRFSIGVELILMVTVLAGMAYHPVIGFFVGATALLAVEIFNQSLQHSTIVSFIGLAAISFAMSFFEGSGITVVGISMTILYNVIIGPLYIVLGSEPLKSVVFTVTDVIFNIWVFIFLAPRLGVVLGI